MLSSLNAHALSYIPRTLAVVHAAPQQNKNIDHHFTNPTVTIDLDLKLHA